MAEDIARNKLSSMPSVGSDRDPNAVLEVHTCMLAVKLSLQMRGCVFT